MFGKTYHNLNVIEVSKVRLIQNYRDLVKKYHMPVAPVLKSNAYGHNAVLVAKILEQEAPPFICVDSLYEAYQLLKARIKSQILIMGFTPAENLGVKPLPFAYAVYTTEMIDAIKKYQPQAPIHIFVDTGMHREGVLLKDLPAFVKKCEGLNIEGLMTHFAIKGDKIQMENLKKAQEIISPKWVHGINAMRIGIDLYPGVLTFKSTIVQIKNLEPGDKVGYDFTYTAKKKMKIGIVSAGYNDGVDRKLSNISPFVGRISMNICAVDMAKFPKAKVGDQIILPIKNGILFPYETLIHLNATTKREAV